MIRKREREADTLWFMQKTTKALDTGLASLTKAQGAFLRASLKPGQESERGRSLRSKESAKERERKKDRHGDPSSDGAKVL